jgi:hypothetical protein
MRCFLEEELYGDVEDLGDLDTIGSPGAWGDRGFGSLRSRDRRGVWADGNAYPLMASTCDNVDCSAYKRQVHNKGPGARNTRPYPGVE